MRKKNRAGEIFGYLTVLDECLYGPSPRWRCRCACGEELFVIYRNLRNGTTRSCGCRKGEFISEKIRLRPYEALYNRLKGTSKVRAIECCLTYEQFIVLAGQACCHYCNQPITWSTHRLNINGAGYNLDRKDNTKGYSTANCIVCCGRCNKAKNSLYSYEEWRQMTATFRRTEQMKSFEVGEVVVHKSLGSQPLVVIGTENSEITVRYGNVTQESGTYFTDQSFRAEELETPVESIEREAEIFKALNAKKQEINDSLASKPSSAGISHLN